MKCGHVSSIVTEANHNSAVCLFRSSFEKQQTYEGLFFFNLDGLSQKISTFIKKQNALANWASIKDLIQLKGAFKNIISTSV